MSHAPDNLLRLQGTAHLLSEEERIIAACRSGDWSCYGQLVQRYQRMVWAAVDSVLSDSSEVPDVVQEVFIRAYEKLSTFRGESAFSTWLYRLARNHALSHLRSRKRRPAPLSLDAGDELGRSAASRLPSDGLVPEQQYFDARKQQELSAMLARLEPNYREVLNLYYLSEFSLEEMVQVLGIPLNTVKTRLRRAKLRLIESAQQGGWR